MDPVTGLLAWLRLFRAANLPTAWSNVVLGVAVGASTSAVHARLGPAPGWVLLNEGFVLLLSATLLYAGAVAMNDAADAPTDARERPGRPVPSGAVRQAAALRAGKLGVLGGLALLVVYPRWQVVGLGTLLAVVIVAYNALHLRFAWTLVLPAVCRGLLVGIAVFSVPEATGLDAAAPAAAVAAAVLAVSVYARNEAERPGRPRRVGWLLAGLPLLDAALCWLLAGNADGAGLCLACGLVALSLRRWFPPS